MKRSKKISLRRIGERRRFALAPVSLAVASAVLLTACDSEKPMYFQSVNDCSDQYPDQMQQCELAYKQALAEAAQTAPKYQNMAACAADFGDNSCVQSPQVAGLCR